MENSTAHETTAVAPSLEVVLPPLFHIDARENGSDIKQVAVPSWRGPAAVGPFKEGRITGFTITPAGDLPPILLLTNSAQPSDDCTHALRLRGAEPNLSAPVLDLTSAKWIKHPEPLPPLADIADYESRSLIPASPGSMYSATKRRIRSATSMGSARHRLAPFTLFKRTGR